MTALMTTDVSKLLAAAVLAAGLCLTSCSGLIPNLPGVRPVVTPAHLAQYSGGGSLSTLWYDGSDAQYHYFHHLAKVRTGYRIKRTDLTWKEEFPLQSRDPVYASRELARYR